MQISQEFAEHLAATAEQMEIALSGTPVTRQEKEMFAMLDAHIASGVMYEVRPGVFKYTKKGAEIFRENIIHRRPV